MPVLLRFFAPAARGVGSLLADELKALGAISVAQAYGGVAFQGSLDIAYRACLWSRTAARVLLQVGQCPAATPEMLYAGAHELPWEEHLAPDGTLAVDCTVAGDSQLNTHYLALKVKDAIVDRFRAAFGQRPSVALERPDLRINIYIRAAQATLYVDLSGESLHKRGYRLASVRAPLKENLAAALLLYAGWRDIAQAGGAMLDPLCGSGTLPIEGALIAADIAPGLLRPYFGFIGWRQHDAHTWARLLEEAQERRAQGLRRAPPIFAYDGDAAAVAGTAANSRAAGVESIIRLQHRSLSAMKLPPGMQAPGLLITNPPYGERLGHADELKDLYQRLGVLLTRDFRAWHAAVFSANADLMHSVNLAPARRIRLNNGGLESVLYCYRPRAPAKAKCTPSPTQEPAAIGRRPASLARIAGEGGTIGSADGGVREETAVFRDVSRQFGILRRSLPVVGSKSAGALMFAQRLAKNMRHFGRWARREGVQCYRIYDADLPEYALAIDLYQGEALWVQAQEYAAPASIDPVKATARLHEAMAVLTDVLELPPEQLFLKQRRRQKGLAQYEKQSANGRFYAVTEDGAQFWVNFTDYLDTGLFLDQRLTRRLLHDLAGKRRFLNLFAYTGTASVCAAQGGAATTTSVDLSHTYLEWAQRNMRLNAIEGAEHAFVREDCLAWLQQAAREKPVYDLIYIDPPTFSNSKGMHREFDIQRDHVALLQNALRVLVPGGVLIFSTNYRRFKLERDAFQDWTLQDLTRATLPVDFARNPKVHQCWKITRIAL